MTTHTLKALPPGLRSALAAYAKLMKQKGLLETKLMTCESVFGNASERSRASKAVKLVLKALREPADILAQQVELKKEELRTKVRGHLGGYGLEVGAIVTMPCRVLKSFVLDDNLAATDESYRTEPRTFRVEGFSLLSAEDKDRVTLAVVGKSADKRGRFTGRSEEYRLYPGLTVTEVKQAPQGRAARNSR